MNRIWRDSTVQCIGCGSCRNVLCRCCYFSSSSFRLSEWFFFVFLLLNLLAMTLDVIYVLSSRSKTVSCCYHVPMRNCVTFQKIAYLWNSRKLDSSSSTDFAVNLCLATRVHDRCSSVERDIWFFFLSFFFCVWTVRIIFLFWKNTKKS